MEEKLVAYETARIASEKDFNEYYLYDCIMKNHMLYIPKDENIVPIPSQSLLQKWLRDVHGIQITIVCKPVINRSFKPNSVHYFFHVFNKNRVSDDEYTCSSSYETYEAALEDALLEGLKIIK